MSSDHGKFRSDVAWNVASLAVLGVAGLTLNVLIAEHWDAATLGVFNQALAAYTFFSMLAVGGIDRSALKTIAADPHDARRVAGLLASSFLPTLALAALATLAYWLAREPLARMLDSPRVAAAIEVSAPGLFFFALNKVLLAALNGVQRMRAFALYQSLRYGLILAALFVAIATEMPGERLAYVFSVAEIGLFLVLGADVVRMLRPGLPAGWSASVREHLAYGAKSGASGVLLELNAKVDIWMIGWLMSDDDVGVYTFAAMVAEGLFQLLVALQNVYNPILARTIALGRHDELRAVVRRGSVRTWIAMAVVGALAVLVYPLALHAIGASAAFDASRTPFLLLVIGICTAAGYVPFGQVLLMAGRPAWHTLFMAATVAVNVVGNALLIPRFGLEGAAAATAIALASSVVSIKVLARVSAGLRI